MSPRDVGAMNVQIQVYKMYSKTTTIMQITCLNKAQYNLQVIIQATSTTLHGAIYCSYAWF